jgi:hypothetical protein
VLQFLPLSTASIFQNPIDRPVKTPTNPPKAVAVKILNPPEAGSLICFSDSDKIISAIRLQVDSRS